MKAWRCAICRLEGEAADARLAERQLVQHWREQHFHVRGSWKERDADIPADTGRDR